LNARTTVLPLELAATPESDESMADLCSKPALHVTSEVEFLYCRLLPQSGQHKAFVIQA
jgi:hypothetical protein